MNNKYNILIMKIIQIKMKKNDRSNYNMQNF